MSMYMLNLKSLIPPALERLLRFTDQTKQAVGFRLQELFNQIAQGRGDYTGAAFAWQPIVQKMAAEEMVCYFVKDRDSSIISGLGGQVQTGTHPVGHAGSTFLSVQGMISEVYILPLINTANSARLIANMAFHELMHNKLDAQQNGAIVASIHTSGGGGLADLNITPATDITDENRNLMRNALFRGIPQFTARL
jgi:hypothetical protein